MNEQNRPSIDELIEKVLASLPSDLRQIKGDFEQHLRRALHNAFARLDLVTREEFDVQAALLARTRERLEQLIERLEQLEASLNQGAKKKKKTPK